jgi:hypothetical protein
MRQSRSGYDSSWHSIRFIHSNHWNYDVSFYHFLIILCYFWLLYSFLLIFWSLFLSFWNLLLRALFYALLVAFFISLYMFGLIYLSLNRKRWWEFYMAPTHNRVICFIQCVFIIRLFFHPEVWALDRLDLAFLKLLWVDWFNLTSFSNFLNILGYHDFNSQDDRLWEFLLVPVNVPDAHHRVVT